MAKKTKKKSILNILILAFNILCAIALLIVYISSRLNPNSFRWFSVLHLFYPYLLTANIIFVIFWIFKYPKYTILSLATILIGWNSLSRFVQIRKNITPDADAIKILSYNVQVFGLYNQQNGKWKLGIEKRDSIMSLLHEQNADIMCFQEYYHNKPNTNFETTNKIEENTSAKYKYMYLPITNNEHGFGLATFSKYPIIHQGSINFDNSNSNCATFADIKIGDDTIRVYNTHLQSLHFADEDYSMAKRATAITNIGNEEVQEGFIKLLRKIKDGNIVRASQAKILKEHMNQSPYKVIVCGDFNDTPWSYTYHVIGAHLNDAFVKSGRGINNTMNINPSLSFRIDYILHDKSLKSQQFTTLDYVASDHLPIFTYISLH